MANHHHYQQEMNVVHVGGHNLSTGFRFHPSDYEIVNHYLRNKVHNGDYTCTDIGEVDLNNIEPWDLPREAKMGDKEWYFFYKKNHKYPTGPRMNRATKAGYWKATGKDKKIYKPTEGEGVALLVGMKKILVFYKGRAPRGDKTNWVMHEYMLEGSSKIPSPASSSSANSTTTMKASASTSKDEWAVCRVFHKTTRMKKTTTSTYQVAMAGVDIDQSQSNIIAMPIPMPLQLPLPVPMPMQFPIVLDFVMDLMAPYYPNTNIGVGMPPMMPPMAGTNGAGGLQINGALFGNPMAAPLQINFYHQMDMGALVGHMGMVEAGQVGMGAAGVGGFDVATPESSLSSIVLQKNEQANDAEISSMMSVTGQGPQPPP